MSENPFSSRFVRPGAMRYRLPSGGDLPVLIARFEAAGREGQIVGPHGSGKSTLLADLIRLWEQQGERVVVMELHDGQRRLPVRLAEFERDGVPTLIAVDGYEQLGSRARHTLRGHCRRRAIGLVVTTHHSMGLPDLARCTPSMALAEQLVGDLLGGKGVKIDSDAIRGAFRRHEGNIREVLFEMYDLCEARGLEDAASEAPGE